MSIMCQSSVLWLSRMQRYSWLVFSMLYFTGHTDFKPPTIFFYGRLFMFILKPGPTLNFVKVFTVTVTKILSLVTSKHPKSSTLAQWLGHRSRVPWAPGSNPTTSAVIFQIFHHWGSIARLNLYFSPIQNHSSGNMMSGRFEMIMTSWRRNRSFDRN